MEHPASSPRHDPRVLAYTAAAMYGAASVDGAIELVLPNVPGFSIVPIVVALATTAFLVTVGPRLPVRALMLFGPIGVACVSYALATTNVTASDAAVLYALPVLWQSLFFGRRGAVAILALVGAGDALALVALGPYGYPERWVDVMISVTAIAAVVVTLERRNARLLQRVSAEARRDPLTGLLNRRGFDERAAGELARLRRDGGVCALVTFDIDHFKRVNDRFGHDVGDRVLVHLATLLAAQAREVDVLARFGGEEFVALLPDTDAAGGLAFGDRVRRALGDDDGGLPPVRVSAGVAAAGTGAELEALRREADLALYDAKRAGRDRTRPYVAGASTRPPADTRVAI